jgi:hypothetical protein
MDRNFVLNMIQPLVQHGLYELPKTSVPHVLNEVAAIGYLMGRGYDFYTARRIVESWEVDESFPPYQYTPYYQPGVY